MRRFSPIFKVAILLALACGGWLSDAQVSAALPAATYRMSGRVTDAHTGAALARCSVEIINVKNARQERTVKSGNDGGFAFDGLPLGKYSLAAVRQGYLAQNYEEHGNFSTAIAVGPGLASENLQFKMIAESVLAGTVTDEAGEPVRGAQVRLFEDQDTEGIRATRAAVSAQTDDRGMYEITGIKPGAYFLMVTGQPWYAQSFNLPNSTQGSQARALDVAYPATFYPGVTEEDAATPIPVKGGERLKTDIALTAMPAMRLRMTLPQGVPEDRFMVMLSHSLFGQQETVGANSQRNPDGSLEVYGIVPGHYDVTLTKLIPGPQGQQREETKHFTTDIRDSTTELSEAVGTGYITIKGTVTSPSGKLPKGAVMGLFTKHRQQQAAAQLDDAGDFSFNAVPPGSYEVISQFDRMYMTSVRAVGASLRGQTLTVKTGDAPKLDIVAGSGYGELEGIALRGNKPASAVMVLLAPEEGSNNKLLFWRDQSDSDGTFGMARIYPGRYHLLAIENGWDVEWANPDVLRAFLQKSVPVELRVGDHLKQSVQVQAR